MNRLFEFIHIKPSPKLVKGPLPIITISREMGSGGKAIANLVARRLGMPWEVFDQDDLNDLAKDALAEKKALKKISEEKIPLIDVIINKIFGRRFQNLSGYNRHLIRVMTIVGLAGNVVILGKGGNFLFNYALKVRVIANYEQRIEWEMTYEGIDRNEAIKRIDESDITRQKSIQELFNHDHKKPYHYDITIKTGPNLTIEDAADIIIDLVKRRFKI